jgi:hypothetical protein
MISSGMLRVRDVKTQNEIGMIAFQGSSKPT